MFLKICSFDLEVLPLNGQMPNAETCPILLCSCTFNYDYSIENTKTRNIIFILTKDYEGIEIQKNEDGIVKRIVYYLKDEVKIINGLFRLIKENDVITGYNISGFDIPYVIDRARALKVGSVNVGLGDSRFYYKKHLAKGFTVTKFWGLTGKIMFDVLPLMRREDESNVFKKKYNLKKLTLEHVSKEILKIEKLEFPIEKMIEYWKDTSNVQLRNEFVDYCSRDSELALMFLTKFRLLDKFITLSKASGRLPQEIIDSMGSGSMVENLLLKEFRKYDRVIPIRLHKESGYKEEELEGAEVFEPLLGVHENICSGDYKSLYPSLMIKHNLCYSTLILYKSDTPEGRWKELYDLGLNENDVEVQMDEFGNPYATFVKKEKFVGIVPRKLTELLGNRAAQKKELKKYEKGTPLYFLWDATQNATKILLNSFYGYSGDADAKIYSWFIASTVTTNGRKQIKKTGRMITEEVKQVKVGEREFILRIDQGDTDSNYVETIPLDKGEVSRDECIKAVSVAFDKVNSTLEKPMEIAFENYIKRIVILAKKRYAMLTVDDNGREVITSKGIETVRRDWCDFSTDTMSKIIDFVLKEKDVNEGVKKSVELVKEQMKLLNEDKIDLNSLVLSKKLTKLITLYDMKAVHVQVAIKMKERGKSSEVGDRIQYIVIDNGKKLLNERGEEADYVIKNNLPIDKDYYINKQLLPPSMRVLSLLGVKEEFLTSKRDDRQGSLSEWF